MIEAGDINDGDILSKSQVETQGNTIRFAFMLPSGQKLTSEWFSPDRRKDAVRAWVDVVRASIVDSVQSKAREKGRAQREAQLKAERGELGLTDAPAAPAAAQSDPVAHAKAQLAALEAEQKHWFDTYNRAKSALGVIERKVGQWNQVIAAFAAGESK